MDWRITEIITKKIPNIFNPIFVSSVLLFDLSPKKADKKTKMNPIIDIINAIY